MALQSPGQDNIKSDSCWLYNYLFENIDAEEFSDIINQTAAPATLASLVSALDEDDLNIKFPAARATANLLALDNEQIVDRLLFHGLVDKFVKFTSLEPPIPELLNEVAFAFSNIAAGTPG
jgi:hypothetical protein